jgi:hypothetical protein
MMIKTNELKETRAKDLKVGDKLYGFRLNDDGYAEGREIYAIKMNKTSLYFAYGHADRIDRLMRLKVAGISPKLCQPNAFEIHYITDNRGFGTPWEKQIEQRKFYKERIDNIKNEIYILDRK